MSPEIVRYLERQALAGDLDAVRILAKLVLDGQAA